MSQLIDIFIGRQPILDADSNLYAYELLFRNHHSSNEADIVGADTATAQVIINAFGDMGLKDIAGDHKVFLNFTEGLLLRKNLSIFPPRQVVLEVLEDIKVSPPLLRALDQLRKQGFTIALDDYIFNPELKPLEDYADVIKVDILDVGPTKLAEHIESLKGRGIKLLAEKVETAEQFEFCKKLGFQYFQGYFFAKPSIIKGQRLPLNKLTVLELLSNVYDPFVDLTKLSKIITQDITLSQKLLKFFAENIETNAPINSVHDGVLRFGLERLQSWASMLALSGLDDKPMELYKMALTRARFCELLGARLGEDKPERYFTVGLFSKLDAIMDTELKELLQQMKLDEPLIEALTSATPTKLGIPLCIIKELEMGSTQFEVPNNITGQEISNIYLQAMQFAESVFNTQR